MWISFVEKYQYFEHHPPILRITSLNFRLFMQVIHKRAPCDNMVSFSARGEPAWKKI